MRTKIVVFLVVGLVLGGVAFGQETKENAELEARLQEIALDVLVRGDFADEEEYLLKVVAALKAEFGPDHPVTLGVMTAMGISLYEAGAYAEAREIEEEVLETRRRSLGADHPDTLRSMHNLALTLKAQGDFQGAREMFAEVSETLRRTLGADHPVTLTLMANLAGTLCAQDDFQGAREMGEEVLEKRRRTLGANHPDTLKAMHNLANTLYELKDLDHARSLFEEILEIRQTTLGRNQYLGTEDEYRPLSSLADIYRDLQKPDEAAQRYLQALDALEAQTRTLAAAEDTRSSFKAQWESTYRDALKTLLVLGRKEEAHHVLERFRAQGVLRLLAERDIVPAEMPPDLEERRRDLDAQYDRTVFVRHQLDPNKQKEAYIAVIKRQQELRRERERLNAELRRRAPNVAELTDPQPLTIAQIRSILEPGTLMLSYMVGPEKTYLFTLSRDDEIVVHKIDIDEFTFWQQTARFFEQLQQTTASKTQASTSKMAAWLYGKLLGDVTEQVRKSERLLILPDGPIFYIPFAALVGPDGRYLGESKAIHNVVSATVYAQLQKRRRSEDEERPMQIAAFGNPSYPKAKVETNERIRTAMERGFFDGGLLPLPSSGREVVEIGELYPSSRTFLGQDASEENVKALADDIGIIHLAAHGVADPITPLDSFVALSVTDDPQRENGLLQAWEIYERLRLDADLVVLSACQTALGRETDGEGLISLSRAFQVAGARTVVASLWSVNDESTAEFMIRFYKHLKAGKTKDEALRAAQLEFIRGPVKFTDTNGKLVERDFSSPYYWAPFQVIGDWR